jgi:hypothetical protein
MATVRQRVSRATVVALAIAVVLAACAPAALGARSAPHRLDRDGPVAVRPGDRVFVQYDAAPAVFELGQADLAPRWQPWTPNVARAIASHRFSVRDVVAPDGWDLSLDRVVAYLSAGRPAADLEIILRLDVPADARLGGQRVQAQVVDLSGRAAPVEIVVQVGR